MSALGGRVPAVQTWQVTLGLALLVLGFLIAAQLASERPRVRYTTQERSPLIETVRELQQQQEDLKSSILALRQQIQDLEGQGEGSALLVRQLNEDLQEARIAAGMVAISGPGVVFRAEDGSSSGAAGRGEQLVTAKDLRTLVEELWLAGAEAVAVNNERVLAGSAFIDIGGTVLVNSAYLAPPYTVTAIGPANLYARVSASRGFVELVRVRAGQGGIRLSVAESSTLRVPAFAGSVTLSAGAPATTAPASAAPAGEPAGSAIPGQDQP